MKDMCKKFIIWSIIIILMVAYLPIGEIYAYTNEIKENSQQNIQKNENITLNEIQKKEIEKNDDETTEIQDKVSEKNESSQENIVNSEIKPINKTEVQNKNEKQSKKVLETNKENNSARASYSDLVNFVSEAKIFNQNGDQVTEVNPDETYRIQLRFDETEDKQFTVNNAGTMTYQLPEFIKMISAISEQDIVSSEGVKLGKYSISMDGLVTVTWDDVDREGNIINESYIDYYDDAFLLLTFDSNLSIDHISEDIVIDFGNNVKINVSFDDKYSLVVNKQANINDDGQKYNYENNTINYNVQLMVYGDMKSLQIEDNIDPYFEIDITKPITVTLNYKDGRKQIVTIDINNYPNSILVNGNAVYGLDVNKYISINNNGFILNYLPEGGIIPSQTEIITNYTTKIKAGIIEENNNGTINYNAKNTVTAKGVLNSSGNQVNSTDTEEVPISIVKLYKQGQFVEAGDINVGNKEDVIVWYVQVGDGSSKVSTTTITDTLGEGLSFALDEPCRIVLYDKDGNELYLPSTDGTLSSFAQMYGISINGDTLTWTVPSWINGYGDVEVYRADIYYCTYFEKTVDTGYETFRNTVNGKGPIGDVSTGAETWVAGELTAVNKEVDPIKEEDEFINYTIEMPISQAYYGEVLAFYDLTELHISNVWNGESFQEKVYHINYEEIKDVFEQNLEITATTESGQTITFVNVNNNPNNSQYTYYISYGGMSNYGQVRIIFNGYDEFTSKWNINENSILNIKYKIPINTTVRDRNNPLGDNGTLKEYAGEKITNIVEVLTKNDAIDEVVSVGKDQVDVVIPETIKKEYAFIDNTNIAKFNIELNKEKQDLLEGSDTLTIIDTMSPSLEFLENTLEIYKYNDATGAYDIKIDNYTFTIEKDVNTDETIVRINVPDGERLEIRYNCLMTGTGVVDVSNLAKIEGVVGTSSRTEYSFEVQNSSAVSGGSETGLDFYIIKYGEKDNIKTPLNGVQFEIYKIENNQKEIIATVSTDANGKIELDNMEEGTYYLRELITIEPDYMKLNGDITLTIDEDNNLTASYKENGIVQVLTDGSNQKYVEIINKAQELIQISGTKIWNDFDNKFETRPEQITINLLADGKVVESKTITADINGEWKYSFTDLEKYDEGGREISYTIQEVELKNYTTTLRTGGTSTTGINIENTLITTNVSGQKTWEDFDNKFNTRPSEITVNLLANGEKVDSKTVTADNNWAYEFNNIPKYDANGDVITYTVNEEAVNGYNASYEGNDIKNTLITTNVSGQKTWEDFDNKFNTRPSEITVNLLANGEKVDSRTVTADNNWAYEFNNIPMYDVNGDVITYTVNEEAVNGYNASYEGNDIKNTLITTNVSGQKTWEDFDNKFNTRPTEITVNLLANGEKVDSRTVTADNNWAYEFNNIPKYDENGNFIIYTVNEEAVNGYNASYEANNIKNTLITTKVEGQKTWEDFDNKFNTRPTEITVNLLANGEKVDSRTVTADNNWGYEFNNIPMYDVNGDGYNASYEGNNIKNKLITTKISGIKIWYDNGNINSTRPTEITVNLLANGEKVDSRTVTADNNWAYEFNNIPMYDVNGDAITYTVSEDNVNGYTAFVSGTNIINTLEATSVSGQKIWEDNDNRYETRPSEITVNLLANGKKIDSKTVTAENNWAYEFNNIPKYDENGNFIIYTVNEEAVNGYNASYEGNDIKNTLITTNVSGQKTWEDFDNKFNTRPTEITVNLLANGEKVDSRTVTADNNWAYEFNNIPMYDVNGDAITYTVNEETVKGYNTSYEGNDIKNTLITTNVSGQKTWEDFDNKFNTRPTEITVNLLANGEKVDSRTVTADNNWAYEFNNIPKYDENGNFIIYTVNEEAVNGYNASYEGNDIKNTLITTNVSGQKTWEDFDNKFNTRPTEITVNLLANGEKVDSRTVTADNNWAYEFNNIPVYDVNGDVITYTVNEEIVKGYNTSYEANNIKNTLITTKVEGQKTWEDFDNKFNTRPSEITVNLLANGEKVDSRTVTADNNWVMNLITFLCMM